MEDVHVDMAHPNLNKNNDPFLAPALQALDATFDSNYPKDWEFYEIIKDYLKFIRLVIERRDNTTDCSKVSDFINSLLLVLGSGSREINVFTATTIFNMYFEEFESEINGTLSKYNILMTKTDGVFTIIPKIQKRKRSIEEIEIPIKNSFSVLAENENEGKMDDSPIINDTPNHSNDNTESESTKKRGKPYQLFFEINKNCKNILQQLHTLSNHIVTRYVKNQIQVTTDCLDSYRTIQKYLTENKIPARTLDLKSERPKKFIIRGLPVTTDLEDISDALSHKGIEPLKIAYLTNRRTKQPMPLFLATLKPSPALDKLFEIKQINYLAVSFEPYNSTGYAQCYRCQEFGHSSLTCNLTPKCVKCSQPHRASQCNATPDDFRCANCGGKHTANYKGCPLHPSNRSKTRSRSRSRQKKNFVPAPAPTINAWKTKDTPSDKIISNAAHPNKTPDTQSEHNSKPTEIEQIKQPPLNTNNNDRHIRKQSAKNVNINDKRETKSTPKVNENSKNKKTNQSKDSDNPSFTEILKTISELMKIFNLNDILNLFKEITKIMREQDDPIQKLLNIFEIIANYFDGTQHG